MPTCAAVFAGDVRRAHRQPCANNNCTQDSALDRRLDGRSRVAKNDVLAMLVFEDASMASTRRAGHSLHLRQLCHAYPSQDQSLAALDSIRSSASLRCAESWAFLLCWSCWRGNHNLNIERPHLPLLLRISRCEALVTVYRDSGIVLGLTTDVLAIPH